MLNAAMELVLEHGAKVSMMAIGQRSGFSHGLVLARFGSKAGLVEAMAEEAQRRFADSVNSVAAGTAGIAKLYSIIDVYLQPPSDDAKVFYVLLGESLGPDPHLHAAFARADDVFRHFLMKALLEAQKNGEIDTSVDAATTAILLVGMLRGVAMQHMVNPDAVDMDAVRDRAHHVVNRLLAPSPSSERQGEETQCM